MFNVQIFTLDRLFPAGKEPGQTEWAGLTDSLKAGDPKQNGLIGIYLGNLEVSPVRNSRLVNLSYESKNPRLAAAVVNSHARLYIEQNTERRLSAAKDAINWLNEKIAETKASLEKSEATLQKYRQSNNLISTDYEEKQNIIRQTLTELNTALN